jgi:uncharacterized protein (TIGR03435 family)
VALRALLATRFGLETHTETREGRVYDLVLDRDGKIGPRLRRSAADCATYAKALFDAVESGGARPGAEGAPFSCFSTPTGDGSLNVRGIGTIGWLISGIQGFVDRPLIDKTGVGSRMGSDIRGAGWTKPTH